MAGRFFSAGSLWMDEGILLARVITGVFMIYHGYEVFDADRMKGYEQWLGDLHFPSPSLMAYLGKGTELAGGVLVTLGFLT
ncbi:MAG TPA: DoxX family protein, partial [Chitinophagaceae bacterium]|nr:DoxX family protein [Chitinophagaceae bacterium]